MPVKRTQRKFRNKKRKVGRKSRRVKRLKGGGEYWLKKDNHVVTLDDTSKIDSINDASFFKGNEELYKITITDNKYNDKETGKIKNYNSFSWLFTRLNKGSFGFNNTNIKNFLKEELPKTHKDYFETLTEISNHHYRESGTRLTSQQEKSLIRKFIDRIGTDIEEIFKKIDYSKPLEVNFSNNIITFIQDTTDVGKIKYFMEENLPINNEFIEGYISNANSNELKPKTYLNITKTNNIKRIDKEIIPYYKNTISITTPE